MTEPWSVYDPPAATAGTNAYVALRELCRRVWEHRDRFIDVDGDNSEDDLTLWDYADNVALHFGL